MYASVTAGRAEVDLGVSSGTGYTVDDTDTAFGINIGVNINKNFAIEFGYKDFGEAGIKATSTLNVAPITFNAGSALTSKADGWNLGVVGILPVSDSFDVFAKAGLLKWDAEYTLTGSGTVGSQSYSGSFSFDEDGTDAYYGLGGKYHLTETFDLGVEFVRYEVDDADVDVVNAVLLYNF
jgi:hypothetical protein